MWSYDGDFMVLDQAANCDGGIDFEQVLSEALVNEGAHTKVRCMSIATDHTRQSKNSNLFALLCHIPKKTNMKGSGDEAYTIRIQRKADP
jgi:hypothetical protein